MTPLRPCGRGQRRFPKAAGTFWRMTLFAGQSLRGWGNRTGYRKEKRKIDEEIEAKMLGLKSTLAARMGGTHEGERLFFLQLLKQRDSM